MKKELLQRYFVAGSQNFPDLTLAEYEDRLAVMMQSGITAYQFREKNPALSTDEKQALAMRLREKARELAVPFIVDDDVALAIAVEADGVHVGQDDMPITDVVTQVAGQMIVGLSVRNKAEMVAAQSVMGIDYLGVGPVFATATKADAATPLGLDGLTTTLNANTKQLPTVAIGGITLKDLPALRQSGVDGVAVISLLSEAPDVRSVINEMKAKWGTL
ncbi:thiamine phosphate synthase [Weissella confusa]|uniref:thiamine phosphate synthase n=1 Tax=Weissella confusa TaxID=1583 RepID=UPI0035A2F241